MKPFRFFLIWVLVLALFPLFPASAQNCSGVTIQNESNQELDTSRICTAATQWVQKGHLVYIWVTDKPAGSSNDNWLSLRNQTESAWGIYDPSNETFSTTAVAIELTTDVSKTWGQDFAFGEKLFGTPLDTDQVINDLETNLKHRVADGGISSAIIETLNTAYYRAYSQAAKSEVSSVSNSQTSSSSTSQDPWGILILVMAVIALVYKFGGQLGFSSGSGNYRRSSFGSSHRSSSSSSSQSGMGSSRRR